MLSYVTFLCVLALAFDYTAASPQKLIFYDQTNCTGRNETITETTTDLGNTWMRNASSARVVGLWGIAIKGDRAEYEYYPIDTLPPQGKCVNRSEWQMPGAQNLSIDAVIRQGPADMSSSQLILYTGPYFTGTQFTFNSDREQMIPGFSLSVTIHSYAQFSNETWTLFSETEYNGTSSLLRPAGNSTRDTFTYSRSTNILIGSVKKGEQF